MSAFDRWEQTKRRPCQHNFLMMQEHAIIGSAITNVLVCTKCGKRR